MAGSGTQPQARQVEVGAADSGNEQGDRGCSDIRAYLLGSGTIGAAIRVRDLGPYPAYAEGAGQISTQGCPQTDGAATAEGTGRRLGIPTSGRRDGGGGVTGCGELHISPPEHHGAIYCN